MVRTDFLHGCVTFENGWHLSVQHSDSHYCGENTCEIQVGGGGSSVEWGSDTVVGFVTADQLAALMHIVSELPKDADASIVSAGIKLARLFNA